MKRRCLPVTLASQWVSTSTDHARCRSAAQPRLNCWPWLPGLVGSLPSQSRPPTLGCLLNSLVLGLLDGSWPSPQLRGLSGVSGELWDVPLLTGEDPGKL